MKHNNFCENRNQTSAPSAFPNAAESWSETGVAFAPSADEVAKRVYASYGNRRSLPGQEVKRWLEAEAQLLGEGNLAPTRALSLR